MMNSDIKAECDRQAILLADAMYEAIKGQTQTIEHPILNALAMAMVIVEAGVLASISSPVHRRSLIKAMAQARPDELARALKAQKPKMSVELVQIGGRHDA